MILRSLAGRLLGWLLPVVAIAVVLPILLFEWTQSAWLSATASAAVAMALAAWLVRRALLPVNALFRALAGSVNTYRDGEYNFGVRWPGGSRDELGELVSAHAELGEALRSQRQALVQRELLLDTMVQNTPVSMLLIAAGGDGETRVVFSNLAARKLLNNGWKMEGRHLADLLANAPATLRETIARGGDSLFPIDDEETYHLSRRHFLLNGRRHELLLLRRLTSELRREEMRAWKKVIRVISHELNNSLAPVASLAHSGAELVRRGAHERLEDIFSTIEERARHLERFLGGYASFAKLPQPQLRRVDWRAFFASLHRHVAFTLEMPEEDFASDIDPAQLEQALLNLLKNAHESGSPTAEVVLRLTRLPQALRIEVLDRGQGMSETVLQNALVPFYSTKRQGTGLGLALTREIVEAHGGRVSLLNREGGGLCVALQLPEVARNPS
jgi:two-component system nitrogen regulation sensor histidine kinase NtrY